MAFQVSAFLLTVPLFAYTVERSGAISLENFNLDRQNSPQKKSLLRFTGRYKGGFVKGWFWRMCPRSGFRSGGTCECTLVPDFRSGGTSERTLVPVFVPGEHPCPSFPCSFRKDQGKPQKHQGFFSVCELVNPAPCSSRRPSRCLPKKQAKTEESGCCHQRNGIANIKCKKNPNDRGANGATDKSRVHARTVWFSSCADSCNQYSRESRLI